MARILGKIIGLIINIVLIPVVLILSIPVGILKARRNAKSRLLFTGTEQSLLAKAQRAINIENNGLFSPDEDLLEVARCIEQARCEYQEIKGRDRFDSSFSEFLMPRINQLHVGDWDNVISFFDLSKFNLSEQDELHHESVGDLVKALQNYIVTYKRENGISPETVMLDHNIHMMFAHAGIYKNSKGYFGDTAIIPVGNVEGGVTWKAIEPAAKTKPCDEFDDDIPF